MAAQTITAGLPAAPEKLEKLGLALSGGGFRASFFHIGMLAQMARQGLLRHVEVISTVSGGSIIGALYYIHIKKLLEALPDSEVTDRHYVELVQNIERDFMAAVELNIRMLTFANFKANWKMRRADYSRSDYISKLYNDLIYQSVLDNVSKPIQMRELKIYPPGQPNFYPKQDNASRQAKVPILVINATTLNDGRNWRFTAQTMGERFPTGSDQKPIRLIKADPSYAVIAANQQCFTLGHAVGASACVPALFPPLAISGLYRDSEEDIRPQLVDGGVHDNQGVRGLVDEQCTCFIVSDASGQMQVESEPATGALPVLLRSNSIGQDRVRTEVLDRLFETEGGDRIAFMNLRQGLAIREIAWIGPNGQSVHPVTTTPATSLDFGVHPDVQALLSKLRTDLDAFTEVEAYSLMLDGYFMSDKTLQNFREKALGLGAATAAPLELGDSPWRFLQIAPWMKNPTPDYLKQLQVAGDTFFKALFLIPWLRAAAIGLIVLILVVLWPQIVVLLKSAVPVSILALAALGLLVDRMLSRLAKTYPITKFLLAPWETLKRWVVRAALPVLGTPFINLYLKLINPLVLKRGRLEALKSRDPAQAG